MIGIDHIVSDQVIVPSGMNLGVPVGYTIFYKDGTERRVEAVMDMNCCSKIPTVSENPNNEND